MAAKVSKSANSTKVSFGVKKSGKSSKKFTANKRSKNYKKAYRGQGRWKMKEYIKKQIGNIKKFSFAEMTSNSSGKTSGSGTAGLYIVFIGGITFFMGCVDKMFLNKDIDVITQSIILVGIGATLLGYRKSKDNSDETTIIEPIEETTEEETPSN